MTVDDYQVINRPRWVASRRKRCSQWR